MADARLVAAGRQALTLFVGLHLTAITLVALPSAGSGLVRSAWKEPTVQGEFAVWTARLQGLGLDIDQPQLEEALWTIAKGWEDAKDTAILPFRPYYDYAGTWQSWKMFVAPHRFPSRLHIDVEYGDKVWVPVFIERSDEATWNRRRFDHDRMRAAIFRYSWAHFKGSYKAFSQAVALQAASDFPEARRMRIRFETARSPSPDEVRAGVEPKPKWTNERTIDLWKLR